MGMQGGMEVLLGSLSKHSKPKRWTRIPSGVFLQPRILRKKGKGKSCVVLTFPYKFDVSCFERLSEK